MKTNRRRKFQIWSAAVVSIAVIGCAISSEVFASGIGVGNGGSSAREIYIENLKREMGDRVSGSQFGVPELSDWCRRASAILSRELKRAQLQIQRNEMESAWQRLQDALFVVGRSIELDPESGAPLTKTLVDRGLLLSRAIEESPIGSSRQIIASKLNFLFEYVKFVIEMEDYIDRPWYIPYRHRVKRCGGSCNEGNDGFNFQEFQRRYLGYAQKQLEFVAQTLTDLEIVDGYREARPVGDPRIFLKIAELTSAFVAEDVASNLFAYQHSCIVLGLRELSQVLIGFNWEGDRSVYPNYRIAVDATYHEIMQAAGELARDPMRCENLGLWISGGRHERN